MATSSCVHLVTSAKSIDTKVHQQQDQKQSNTGRGPPVSCSPKKRKRKAFWTWDRKEETKEKGKGERDNRPSCMRRSQEVLELLGEGGGEVVW
jgi:hypothetical protein